MKARTWAACLACITLGIILSGLLQPRWLAGQEKNDGLGRVKWDYKVEKNLDSKSLDELGKQGWDLITIVSLGSTGAVREFYLKRSVLRVVIGSAWCARRFS